MIISGRYVLIFATTFSFAFAVAAGLFDQVGGGRSDEAGVSENIAARDCLGKGFLTPEGRITCVTPVVLPLDD